MNKTIVILVACISLLAMVLDTAEARRRAGFSARGLPRGAKANAPVLTLEELRLCVVRERIINNQSEELETSKLEMDAKNKDVEILGNEIEELEPQVDTSSEESVNEFNALIERHAAMVEDFNSRLPPFNAQVEQLNSKVDRFNTTCGERLYYEDDMTIVRRQIAGS